MDDMGEALDGSGMVRSKTARSVRSKTYLSTGAKKAAKHPGSVANTVGGNSDSASGSIQKSFETQRARKSVEASRARGKDAGPRRMSFLERILRLFRNLSLILDF